MAKNKNIKNLAIDLLLKNVKRSFVRTDMGSGWRLVLYAPFSTNGYTKDVLDEHMYLDIFDAEGIEDWDELSKKDKEYYYNEWKNDLFESSLESFKNKVFAKHLHFFEEEVVEKM